MFRFLVLFGCLLIASSVESNATDKIKVKIYSYGEGDSCLIKAFVLSSEGFYSKSTTIINSCQEYHAENPLPHYYCKMVRYKNSFWSGDLLKAAKTLKDISESKFVIESSHESTIANLTNTASILSKSSVHHSPESLLAYYDETSFVIEDKNRMVDTAALFNSSSRCDKRYSANVADALGKDIKLDVCMNSIGGDIIPTVQSNKSYVIGLINLLKYDRIVFSRTNLSNLKSYKMMRDGNIIFF
jgi:hypothetical protein